MTCTQYKMPAIFYALHHPPIYAGPVQHACWGLVMGTDLTVDHADDRSDQQHQEVFLVALPLLVCSMSRNAALPMSGAKCACAVNIKPALTITPSYVTYRRLVTYTGIRKWLEAAL